jgi:hypothetical protein
MAMNSTQSCPEQHEGLPFSLKDLRLALAWAENRSDVRLYIKLDYTCIIEAIEIYPARSLSARWFIWRTHKGRLRVDDWAKGHFGLPYETVEAALQFIASVL